MPSLVSLRLLGLAAVPALALTLGCRREPAPAPAPLVPAPAESSGEGFRPFGAERPGDDMLPATETASTSRPPALHTAPPTPDDFAVTPVVGDWIAHRGDAARSGLRDAPGITSPNVRWAVQVGIQGYANSPLVAGDTVYVASQGNVHNQNAALPDEGDGVVALDATTGAQRWRFRTANDANGMTLHDGVLYVSTDRGGLYALDTTNGQQRWHLDMRCHLFHGPWVHNGTVYVVRRDGVAQLDAATGAPRTALGDCPGEERGAISGEGEWMYAASSGRELEVWRNGEPAWSARDEGAASVRPHAWSPPQLTRSMVVASYASWPFEPGVRGGSRNAVVAFWRDDTHPAWVIDVNDPALTVDDRRQPTAFLRAQPWILGDRLYFTPTNRGELVAYDVTTGAIVETLALPDCRRRQFASIVGTPSMAYLARHDGMLYAFTPSPLRIVWSLQLGMHGLAGGSAPSVSVTAGCSELPDDGTALFATPAIGADGTLYVAAGDGWIYAIGNPVM